jgi:hypothetical protein
MPQEPKMTKIFPDNAAIYQVGQQFYFRCLFNNYIVWYLGEMDALHIYVVSWEVVNTQMASALEDMKNDLAEKKKKKKRDK